MKTYRKKPLTVEAYQWTSLCEGDTIVQQYQTSEDTVCEFCGHVKKIHGWVNNQMVCPGDFIIAGENGNHTPCKPDVFLMNFESNIDYYNRF